MIPIRATGLLAAALALAWLTAGCGVPSGRLAAKSKPVPPVTLSELTAKQAALKSYEMTMSVRGQQIRQAVKLDRGRLVRIRSTMDGGWMLMKMDERVQFMYDPQRRLAIKMPMPERKNGAGAPTVLKDLPGPGDITEMMGRETRISSTDLEGTACWLVENPAMKSWVDKKYGLVRKHQMGESVITFDYARINSVPAGVFEVPPGTKVRDMGSVPGKQEPAEPLAATD